jgi:RNA polymerase sigma-70 factor, ECF subfamily
VSELKRVLSRAAAGDEEAAESLFDAYYPRVFRYALGRLADQVDAEDVASDTFAVVLRDLASFKWRRGGFEAWLFRIASNLVADLVETGEREVAPGAEPSPVAVVLRGDLADELGPALTELPPDQREVLLLRFAGGLETHEAAVVMRRRASTVRRLQLRALTKLRAAMPERQPGWE